MLQTLLIARLRARPRLRRLARWWRAPLPGEHVDLLSPHLRRDLGLAEPRGDRRGRVLP